jgi:hypothetical protein
LYLDLFFEAPKPKEMYTILEFVRNKETGSLEDLQDMTAVLWINKTQNQFPRPADGKVSRNVAFHKRPAR